MIGRPGAVRLAEGMAARDQGHRLLVVHGHPREGVADVVRRRQRIGIAVRPFRVDVDQPHLHRRQRVLQIARMLVAVRVVVRDQHGLVGGLLHPVRAVGVAQVAAQPGRLAPPIDVLIRLPDILAPAGEAEGAETHGLQRHVSGQDQQVGPGDGLAVLLLDRPQQAARLVDIDVVGPGVQRREPLLAPTAAAAAVADTIGAGAVPGHADELRPVMAEVGGPPVLRIRHQLAQVRLQRLVVQRLERFGIAEVLPQRVGPRRMLVQQIGAQLARPPVAVLRPAARDRFGGAAREGAFGFVAHGRLSRVDGTAARRCAALPLVITGTFGVRSSDRSNRLSLISS